MKPAIFVAAWLAFSETAFAQQLLIDAAPTPTGSLGSICNGGVTVAVQVTRPTTIGRVKQQLTAASASTVRFAIWSGSSLVFYSPAVAVGAGSQVVESPDFTFQLVTGVRYHIGALIAGCADFPTDATVATANGVQTFAQHGLPTNFGAPVGPNQVGASDPRVLLFTPSTDADGDSFQNAADNCPFDYQLDQADVDGDGQGDACDTQNNNDPDGDGVPNASDNCPFDTNAGQADTDGDGLGDACDGTNGLDLDGDGVNNTSDNCPFKPNATQTDTDGDGIGDVCDPQVNGANTDIDADGVSNLADNCPFDANAAQLDKDLDGLGDVCDARDDRDLDGDGVHNTNDNCPFIENADQVDLDADGVGDDCDQTNGLDLDDDGFENAVDNCPFEPNPTQDDADDDGFGDVCDKSNGGGGGGCSTTPGASLFVLAIALLLLDRQRLRHR